MHKSVLFNNPVASPIPIHASSHRPPAQIRSTQMRSSPSGHCSVSLTTVATSPCRCCHLVTRARSTLFSLSSILEANSQHGANTLIFTLCRAQLLGICLCFCLVPSAVITPDGFVFRDLKWLLVIYCNGIISFVCTTGTRFKTSWSSR